MGWIQDIVDPKARLWEELYRNRWEYDRLHRSTHGVNCTGGCSWEVYVKDGIVVWELQATDYPSLEPGLPGYEPRGCQRGITFSWYIYSPLRVKYPYIRGVLADMWRKARAAFADPVEAWASIMEDEEARKRFQKARGKGGLRRTTWDEAVEIISAATLYTIKKYGPDRLAGFTPIPAMSMLSYASGARFLQLLGGVVLSFYDWYADFPPAFPEVWGDKTDVGESADWYNSKMIAVMGSNLNMTRTPDVHFAAEARNNGSKLVVFSPDFSQLSKYADWWLPVRAGQDAAFWMAVDHVILKEFYADAEVPFFSGYLKKYTDAPFLVEIEVKEDSNRAGKFLRAGELDRYKGSENPEWKLLVFDAKTNSAKSPNGSIGFRWQKREGLWNLNMKDGEDGSEIEPVLSFIKDRDAVIPVDFHSAGDAGNLRRGVPVKYIETARGPVAVSTAFDLMTSQFGVSRGLEGDYPEGYGDNMAYTPAWQEKHTGISADTVVQFAREWARTAVSTRGKCMVIAGSGVNHWYNANLIYRSAITALMLCGCVGVNGGGMNHYTGQEKIVPESAWRTIAFATDWLNPPRLQNTPSYHYVHSCQWRYDSPGREDRILGNDHPMDMQAMAVRLGWLPFYPQFDRSTIGLVKEAAGAGAKTDDEIISWLIRELKEERVRFAVEEPDRPENWPRVLFIWRGNALHTSAKGEEYSFKHYLGTGTNEISEETKNPPIHDVSMKWPAPEGKLDLVVDLNFRMDTSALYSDIILPSASWYEKDDMNTTDLHSYIHPLSAAVPPCWESKDDWEIFKTIARKVSELSRAHFPRPFKDIVATPLMHDSRDEMAQPSVKDWKKGECEPIPGKTMPRFTIVERNYPDLYNRYISFGHLPKKTGMHEKGVHWQMEDLYYDYLKGAPSETWGGKTYISLSGAREAANVVLFFAPETNGEVSHRGFEDLEKKTGVKLAGLAEETRGVRYSFADLLAQPRRILTSPCWTGITNRGRAYSAFVINVERGVPWRTLSGRQHFYMDHEGYREFNEGFPTFKAKLTKERSGDLRKTASAGRSVLLNCLTPHGKWHIHSTYSDNLLMLLLSRGVEPFWLNLADAAEIGVRDNDWVEVYNDNGVVVTRAVLSARIPRGVGFFYHAPERTMGFPKSPLRNMKRGGGTNALTRVRLKPLFMIGGYAQFSYAFNYWGPPAPDRDTYALVRKLEGKPVF